MGTGAIAVGFQHAFVEFFSRDCGQPVCRPSVVQPEGEEWMSAGVHGQLVFVSSGWKRGLFAYYGACVRSRCQPLWSWMSEGGGWTAPVVRGTTVFAIHISSSGNSLMVFAPTGNAQG